MTEHNDYSEQLLAMGSKRGSITHVQDVERLAQELKHCKQKDKQRDLLEELAEVALLPPGRDKILAHGGIPVIADMLMSEDTAVRLAADEALRRIVEEERCRLQVVKKLVPLLKHISLKTRLHAMVHIANLSIESTLNRAWLLSSGVLPPVLSFLDHNDVFLRETALGCLFWLSREFEVPPQVVAKAGCTQALMKSVATPCGPGGRERRYALHILALLPASSAGIPAMSLMKCLSSNIREPSAEEAFALVYPDDPSTKGLHA